jgi:hypothetical protein
MLVLMPSGSTSSQQAASFRSKSDRTADVRTIFKRDEHHINVDTGKEETGHWCRVCKYVCF